MPWYIILKDVFLPEKWQTNPFKTEGQRRSAYDVYMREKESHWRTVEKLQECINKLEKKYAKVLFTNDKLVTENNYLKSMSFFQLIKWYFKRNN